MARSSAVRASEAERDRAVAAYTWLTTAEAGIEAGGVSPDTVREWIRTEQLRALNVGTAKRPDYRIKPEWVRAFVARRTVNPDA